MNYKLPELISVKELKEYLGLGLDKTYALVKRKDFPSFKIGGKYFVNKDKLADWIERQCKKAAQ